MTATRTLVVGVALVAICSSHALAQSRDVPKPDSYRAYWPGECVEAIRRTDAWYRRAGPDTTRFSVARDSMFPGSAAAARDCVAQFTVASVLPRDLVELARVYLADGDDAQAAAAVTRRLTADAATPLGARAETLGAVFDAYADAHPARLADARRYLAQLDALAGPDAARERLAAHMTMAGLMIRANDTAAVTAESEAMIAAGKLLTPDDRNDLGGVILSAYIYLGELAGSRTGTAAAPKAVAARLRADLGSVPGLAHAIAARDTVAGLYGRAATTIRADRWIGNTADTVHPKRGTSSLIVFNPIRANIAAYRRLAARGIDIVFARGTREHFEGKGPLDVPAETEILRAYYTEELAMPGTMALSASAYDRLPDRRRVRLANANEVAYRNRYGVGAVLVDRRGVIRRVYGRWMPWTELRVEEALAALQ